MRSVILQGMIRDHKILFVKKAARMSVTDHCAAFFSATTHPAMISKHSSLRWKVCKEWLTRHSIKCHPEVSVKEVMCGRLTMVNCIIP